MNEKTTSYEQMMFADSPDIVGICDLQKMLGIGRKAALELAKHLPGEVTPELCHKIGVELAEKLWGDRYQVLVATHLNRSHLHNHFILNPISFIDGKKIDSGFEATKVKEKKKRQNNI